jgi:hypothetical protein
MSPQQMDPMVADVDIDAGTTAVSVNSTAYAGSAQREVRFVTRLTTYSGTVGIGRPRPSDLKKIGASRPNSSSTIS